jgi:hypothetical protein
MIINNTVIDSINNDFNYILNQLYYQDEDALLLNYAAGSTVSHRYGLTNTNNSNWYVNLKTLFNQTNFSLLSNAHEIQLRITMQPLSNVLNQGALVGTPSVTINSVSLLARVTQLTPQLSNNLLLEISKIQRDNLFLATRHMPVTIQSGVLNSTIVLTGIVGSVHSIYFVVRPSSGLTKENQYNYTAIKDFQILNSSGNSLIGGSVVPSTFNLLVQQRWWVLSSFPAQAFTGTSNSYVYMYSFSVDPSSAMKNSANYSSQAFTGNEQLIINFNNALPSTHQIDIFSLVESSVKQGANSIQLIAL